MLRSIATTKSAHYVCLYVAFKLFNSDAIQECQDVNELSGALYYNCFDFFLVWTCTYNDMSFRILYVLVLLMLYLLFNNQKLNFNNIV